MKVLGYQQASNSMLQQQQQQQQQNQQKKERSKKKKVGRTISRDDSHTEITQSSDGGDDLSVIFVSDIGFSSSSVDVGVDHSRRLQQHEEPEGRHDEKPSTARSATKTNKNQKAMNCPKNDSEPFPTPTPSTLLPPGKHSSVDESPKVPIRTPSGPRNPRRRVRGPFPGRFEHVDMKLLWANPRGLEAAKAKNERREAQRQYLRWQQWYSIQTYQRQRTLQRQQHQKEAATQAVAEPTPEQQNVSSFQEETALVIESPVPSPATDPSSSSLPSSSAPREDRKPDDSMTVRRQSRDSENAGKALSAPPRFPVPRKNHRFSTVTRSSRKRTQTASNYKRTILHETNLSPGQVDVDSLLQKYKKVVDDLSSTSSSSDEEDSSDSDSDSDEDSSDSDDSEDQVLPPRRRRQKKAVPNRGRPRVGRMHHPFHTIYTITEV